MDIKKIEVVNIKQHQATNLACGDPGDVQGVKNYRFRTVTYQNKKTLEQCESLPQYIYIYYVYYICIIYILYICILYIYIYSCGWIWSKLGKVDMDRYTIHDHYSKKYVWMDIDKLIPK